MIGLAENAFLGLALVVIAFCFGLWIRATYCVVSRSPLVAFEPRRPAPWSVVELLLIGLLGVVVVGVTQQISRAWLELPAGVWQLEELAPRQQIGALVFFSIASGVSCLLALWVCRRVAGATLHDLGLVRDKVGRDLILGLAGFAMLIVPMLTMHVALQMLFPVSESHPFIEILSKEPRLGLLLPIAVAAVIIAPMVEETFFRVILQGWLERLAVEQEADLGSPRSHWVGSEPAREQPSGVTTDADTASAAPAHDAECAATSETAPGCAEPAAIGETSAGYPQSRVGQAVPILLSSLAFALAHLGHGLAPIPLFFLAIGLGYLYQRTHRLLPCLVIHFLVNLTAMAQLGLEVWRRQG